MLNVPTTPRLSDRPPQITPDLPVEDDDEWSSRATASLCCVAVVVCLFFLSKVILKCEFQDSLSPLVVYSGFSTFKG